MVQALKTVFKAMCREAFGNPVDHGGRDLLCGLMPRLLFVSEESGTLNSVPSSLTRRVKYFDGMVKSWRWSNLDEDRRCL